MNTFDVEKARHNMVEQQIRPWDVLDARVLGLLSTVKREEFVPAQYRALAFADLELPLGNGYAMWAPKVEARVLQALDLESDERVLEIGTGSGYFTALLASEAAHVHTVEIDATLAQSASARLARAGFRNVTVDTGDGAQGFGSEAYDAVVLTGSTPVVPERLFEQVKPGGRLFAIVGDAPAMAARLTRVPAQGGAGGRLAIDLFETVVKPLANAAQPERFAF